MKAWIWSLLLLFLSGASLSAFELFEAQQLDESNYLYNASGSQEVHLTTLDWEPYVGRSLCGQGWVTQTIVAAFAQQNYRVKVEFLPWDDAVARAELGEVDALFPEYFISDTHNSNVIPNKKRLELLALGNEFPGGALMFWGREGYTGWDGTFASIKGEKIAVVDGYVNTAEFDVLMNEGYFQITKGANDVANLRSLLKGDVNLIVGDPFVFRHLLRSSVPPEERQLAKLEPLYPVLEEKSLYVAFARDRAGMLKRIAQFNESLERIQGLGELGNIQETTANCP